MPELKSLMSLLWMFICVIIIIGLAYFFTKYFVGRGRLGSMRIGKNGLINVVTQLTVGRDRQIAIVKTGEKYFLLGVTASQITMLAELDSEEIQTLLDSENDAAGQTPPSFSQALKTVLKDKTKR